MDVKVRSSGTNPTWSLVLFVIFGLVFASVGGWLFWSQQQALNSAEKITGEIESSSVEKEVDRRDTDDDGFRERTVSYYARITYSYTVDGQQYESSNVFPGGGSQSVSQNRAQSLVNEYSEGTQATVWVDTSDPDDESTTFIVREREILFPFIFIAMGLGVAALGVIGLVQKLLQDDETQG